MMPVKIKSAYRCDRDELLWLTIHAPYQVIPGRGSENWGEHLCDRAQQLLGAAAHRDLYAEDIDSARPGSIHVLIRRVDLPAWQQAAAEIDCELVEHLAFALGHYGDGEWPGVDLVKTASDELLWLVLA